MIGMIFQFNSEQGTGLIMLSDGQKKEFSTAQWVDESNIPSIGLEIIYEDSGDLIKIKVPSEEEKNALRSDKKPKKEKEPTTFSSLEEFQSYFSNKGFDLIKNTDETSDNELTMGRLSDEGIQSVSISFKDPTPQLIKNIIPLSSTEDYIQFFKDTGYRLINDFEDGGSRMVSFRRYVMDEHSEIKMKCSDDTITVIKTVNGKEVT